MAWSVSLNNFDNDRFPILLIKKNTISLNLTFEKKLNTGWGRGI